MEAIGSNQRVVAHPEKEPLGAAATRIDVLLQAQDI